MDGGMVAIDHHQMATSVGLVHIGLVLVTEANHTDLLADPTWLDGMGTRVQVLISTNLQHGLLHQTSPKGREVVGSWLT